MKYAVLAGALVLIVAVFALMGTSDDTPITEIDVPEEMPTDDGLEPYDDEPVVDEQPPMDEAALHDDDKVADDAIEQVFNLDSFRFGYSEEEIIVNQGDTVTINLTSSDGRHDWVVDEFNAATEIIEEGETTSVTFVADQVGEFEFYCSVGSHREQGMVGTLIVQ